MESRLLTLTLPCCCAGDGVVDDQDLEDVNNDGLINSADTGVLGDTNGDGVVDDLDTGLVGDTNGEFRSFSRCRIINLSLIHI